MRHTKRVAVLIDTSSTWGADAVRGIARYSEHHGPWMLLLDSRGKYEQVRLPSGLDVDGIVARLTSPELADDIVALGAPAVSVSWYRYDLGRIPRCTTDEGASGRMAAEHFLERGFKRFAYCGSSRRPDYVDLFGDAFCATLAGEGFSCDVFSSTQRNLQSVQEASAELTHWIESLAKPVAMLAFDTLTGRELLDCCDRANASVPEQIAILTGEADQLLCEISHPKLSSMDLSAETVGYRAAELLDSLMSGAPRPSAPLLIPPAGIVARQSTDTLAIEDPVLVAALRHIQDHAHETLRVSQIVRRLPVSRRRLEQQFQKTLGRSPAAEIRRVRVERAKQLLANSELSVAAIAVRCGFEYGEVLTRAFRRETGQSPSMYRDSVRAR